MRRLESAVEPESEKGAAAVNGGDATQPSDSAGRRASTRGADPRAAAALASTRGGAKPFTAYRAEYAYVLSDLRRVALVIGSLLVILLLLNFVLPH